MTVTEAQFSIAEILANVERSTGQHVRGISIEGLDITQMSDFRPQHYRRVVIDLTPIPGSHWEIA